MLTIRQERYHRLRKEWKCTVCEKQLTKYKSRCPRCAKKGAEFLRDRRKKAALDGFCKECRTRPRTMERAICKECRQNYLNRYKKKYGQVRKVIIMEHYGGTICNCCGEKELKMLCLDHINNDGNVHREQIKGPNFKTGTRTGSLMYNWIIKNNYPPLFQVLCFNCNMAKHLNGGVCPHKTSVTDAGGGLI